MDKQFLLLLVFTLLIEMERARFRKSEKSILCGTKTKVLPFPQKWHSVTCSYLQMLLLKDLGVFVASGKLVGLTFKVVAARSMT